MKRGTPDPGSYGRVSELQPIGVRMRHDTGSLVCVLRAGAPAFRTLRLSGATGTTVPSRPDIAGSQNRREALTALGKYFLAMTSRKLRSRELNSVLRVVENVGFDPAEFRWDERTGNSLLEELESLEHEESDSYFAIGITGDGTFYFGQCDPGAVTQVERFGKCDWPDITSHLTRWLRDVKPLDEPNRWVEVGKSQEDLASALGVSASLETTLTDDEQQRVLEWVDSIRTTINETHELDKAQIEILDARLAEIAEASKRLTRKDFLNYAIGSVLTIGIELSLRGSVATDLLRAALTVVTHIVTGFPELSPPHG